jgi:two-component sensor histidine kinase
MDNDLGLIIMYSDFGSSYNSSEKKDVFNINTYEVKPLEEYYKNISFKESQIVTIKKQGDLLVYTTPSHMWSYTHKQGFTKRPEVRQILKINDQGQVSNHTTNDTKEYAIYLYDDGSIYIPEFFVDPLPHTYYELVCKQTGGYLIYSKNTAKNTINYHFLSTTGTFHCVDTTHLIRSGFSGLKIKTFCRSDNDNSTVIHDQSGSVFLYTPTFGFIPLYQPGPNDKRKIFKVTSFYKDRSNGYWLCSNMGLLHVKINIKLFKTFFENPTANQSYDNSARGIYASGDTLFCNMVSGTILKTTQGLKLFSDEQTNPYCYAITAINDSVWIGGSNDLKLFTAEKGEIKMQAKSIQKDIWSIANLNSGALILGCTEGLSIYRKNSRLITPIQNSKFPTAKFVYKLFHNQSNELVVAAENGIYFLSPKGEINELYRYSAADKNKTLPCESVYDLHEDKNGMYWIATNNDGLYRWDRRKHEFRQFGFNSGFISNVIYCIQEDEYNNLWLSTDYGLIKFNKTTFEIKTYTEMDGLTHNEFNRTSSFKDKKGNLYFGGLNGIITFNPVDFNSENEKNIFPFLISNYSQFNLRTNTIEERTNRFNAKQEIILTDNIKFSSLSFSLLDYVIREHLYAYKIEGLDSNWVYTKSNTIRLGDLPYGTYTLKLKAQTNTGTWNKKEIMIPLLVIAPFYKTGWFIVLVVFLLLIVIFVFIKIRLRLLKKQNRELEVIVHERTQELESSLQEKTALIQEIHHRVKNNLQFVGAMLEMQANATQDISHQSSILATSRRINAMTLVHEMLYSKENIENVSVKHYLEELVSEINEMINEENIPIQFTLKIDEVYFDITHCVAIGMITSELLSNSIKYAFSKIPKPGISVTLLYHKENNTVLYTVNDNGIGFDKDLKRDGFGHRLIDIFSRQLKGSYSLDGAKGSSFKLEFKSKKTII